MLIAYSVLERFKWNRPRSVVNIRCPHCGENNYIYIDKRTYVHDKAKVTKINLFKVYIEGACDCCKKLYLWYLPVDTYIKWRDSTW